MGWGVGQTVLGGEGEQTEKNRQRLLGVRGAGFESWGVGPL